MDSLGHVKPSMLSRTLPLTAVFVDDLRQCLRHWAFIAWATIATVLTVLWFVGVGGRASADGVSSAVDKVLDPRHTVENGDAVPNPHYSGYQRTDGYSDYGRTQSSNPIDWRPANDQRLPDAGQRYPTQTANRSPIQWQSYRVNLRALTAAEFGGWIIRWNLLVFGAFAVALGATAVSAESELLEDAILCRGVGRAQYFVAKTASRSLMAAALFLFLAIPTLGFASLRMYNDLSLKGSIAALTSAATVIAAVAALSVAGGAWFRSAMVAAVAVWMGVYGAGILIAMLDVGDLSPFTFCDRCTYLLRGYIDNLPHHRLPNWSMAAAGILGVVSLGFFNFRDL